MLPEDNPLLDRYAYPAYEPVVTERFQHHIHVDDVFYDVGSRYGIYTLLALKLGVDPNNIHTFEKEVQPFEVLKDYIGDRDVHMNNIIVGSEISIDEYVERYNRDAPDVIKMDIEGAEIDVLRGARNILMRETPVLFIEIHPQRLRDNFHSTPEEVINLLRDCGYNNMDVAPQQRTEQTGWKDVDDYTFNMSHNDNALFAEKVSKID